MGFTKRDKYVRGDTVPLGLRLRDQRGRRLLLPCPPDTIELHAPDGTTTLVGPSYLVGEDDGGASYRFDLQTGRDAEIDHHQPGNWEATWIIRYTFRGQTYALRRTYFWELVADQ